MTAQRQRLLSIKTFIRANAGKCLTYPVLAKLVTTSSGTKTRGLSTQSILRARGHLMTKINVIAEVWPHEGRQLHAATGEPDEQIHSILRSTGAFKKHWRWIIVLLLALGDAILNLNQITIAYGKYHIAKV